MLLNLPGSIIKLPQRDPQLPPPDTENPRGCEEYQDQQVGKLESGVAFGGSVGYAPLGFHGYICYIVSPQDLVFFDPFQMAFEMGPLKWGLLEAIFSSEKNERTRR